MRLVDISNIIPGMVVAKDIYDAMGRTLIGRGCALTQEYIDGLEQRGFSGVYIDDELSRDILIEEAISETMRQEGMRCVAKADIDGCMKVSKMIVEELLQKSVISFDMVDLRSYDNYTFAHSVNVAVLSGAIGMGLKLDEKQQYNLVLSALLHDLGKMLIPEEIINKPGRLTTDEYEEIKRHPGHSYDLIKERWDLSSFVKTATLFHHENEDGTGYPQGLTGDQIPFLAKILHVADVYDALISKRPYKNPYLPNEAIEYLMGNAGRLFDQEMVQMLIRYIPLYRKGQEVVLSDGRKGIVFENSGEYNLRPLIKLMDGSMLDLSDTSNLSITIVATDASVDAPNEERERTRKDMLGEKK